MSGIPLPGSFFVPHSLALDSANHTLYVADRENGRVQVFSSISGAFVDEIKLPEFGGLVYAVDYRDNERELLQFYKIWRVDKCCTEVSR